MIDNKNFTNSNVKFLRETKNISQSKMAKDLKIDQSTLAKWENGTRQITLDWAIKISNYFGIDVGNFVSNDYLHNRNNELSSEKLNKIINNVLFLDNEDKIFLKHFIKEKENQANNGKKYILGDEIKKMLLKLSKELNFDYEYVEDIFINSKLDSNEPNDLNYENIKKHIIKILEENKRNKNEKNITHY